ncbi:ribonuclease H-like domain-containing protein [Tanacetum coccineum]
MGMGERGSEGLVGNWEVVGLGWGGLVVETGLVDGITTTFQLCSSQGHMRILKVQGYIQRHQSSLEDSSKFQRYTSASSDKQELTQRTSIPTGNRASINPLVLHTSAPPQPIESFTSPPGFSSLSQHHNLVQYYMGQPGQLAGHATLLPNAFGAMTLQDPPTSNWNMYTDFMTRRVLLCCDSTGDLYPITKPFTMPHAFLTSEYTWHQRLGHPGNEGVTSHCPVHQLDIKNAFLHGGLSETIYMYQPLGFWDSDHPDYVCLLQRQGTDIAYLLLYVDDIVPTASSKVLLQKIITSLHQEFSMTDLGSLNYFLGISVTRDSSRMFLSQRKYAAEILERAHMVNCNFSRTPVGTESKLGDDGDPVSDPTFYRSLAVSLRYLTFTRSDISYLVQQVCLYMHDPREPYLSALKRILRNLIRELHTHLSSATLVYCDNVSAIYLSSNPIQHQRTKHIEIDIHVVRDLIVVGQVRVFHVPSRYQYADIFTKGLSSTLFEEFRTSLSIPFPPAQNTREC